MPPKPKYLRRFKGRLEFVLNNACYLVTEGTPEIFIWDKCYDNLAVSFSKTITLRVGMFPLWSYRVLGYWVVGILSSSRCLFLGKCTLPEVIQPKCDYQLV